MFKSNKRASEENFENNNDDDSQKGSNVENVNERRSKQMVVVEGGEQVHEQITIINKKKTPNENTFIITCLKNHFVFYNLNEAELENIVKKMFYCEVAQQQFIFQQSYPASSFFILERGSMEVIVNDKTKRELKAGDGFGELALLYNAPRSASVRALELCNLWGIDRNTFRRAVEEMITKEYEENRKFMEVVRFFHNLTNEQKDAIAAVLIVQKFYKNQIIVTEGDPASSFYIIKEGTVTVLKGTKEVRKLYKGDSFGEQALYYNTVRQMTVRAEDEVKCLALGRDTLTKILGDQVHAVTFRNLQKWAFEKNNLLTKLNKAQIDKVLDVMKISSYKAGDIIMKKGTIANQKIVVIIEGSLKKAKSGITVASKAQAWGEEFLLENQKAKTFDDDIVMETDGVIAEITSENFTDCIGGQIEEIIKQNESSREKKMQKIDPSKREAAKSIKLDTLIYIKTIAFGQFGPVYLVKSNYAYNDQYYFALKAFNKIQISEQSLEKYIYQEKQVLEIVNFPFIIQYARAFKDNCDVYFLVEFVKGMELFDVIRDIGLLNTYDSQFYVASMILILEYLHHQNVIFRDMKPENLMVDEKGYLKLIDLGTAKILKGKHGMGNRTFTIIGTPHYMAPEIICGKGYNCFVDLWSVGICLYEFMCGMVPFGEEAEDPYEIYEEIIKKDINYPTYLKDKKAKKLMDQLLSRVPEVRFGGSYPTLKSNPWFENFDWDKLLEKELKPPYTPPTDKLTQDTEIKKAESEKKLIIDEITHEQKVRTIDKDQSADTPWDKDFMN
ncbi:Protein kinase-like domain [Pseudocohnilembus persalinus]|uniref:cGMP-dependent protein kinase n=1 Tax=Pseudocohnilembus persalinus TaxID=266149 RepID=A0A0V0QM68_PSEPJ|nr:Protein kinase-like domain [Pseudocohnilembus persalinus]|eukprot:KRX03427.1 Protein kinase-like domain [Pseudocohnilembus persalinus]